MDSFEECLLKYRQRLRTILAKKSVASNPAVDDKWILDRIEELILGPVQKESPQKIPQTFEEMMKDERWIPTLQLLKEKRQSIIVVESEDTISYGKCIFIDGEGFKSWSGIVGMVAVHSRKTPKIKLLTTPEEILRAIRECDNGSERLPPEFELVAILLRRIDQLEMS